LNNPKRHWFYPYVHSTQPTEFVQASSYDALRALLTNQQAECSKHAKRIAKLEADVQYHMAKATALKHKYASARYNAFMDAAQICATVQKEDDAANQAPRALNTVLYQSSAPSYCASRIRIEANKQRLARCVTGFETLFGYPIQSGNPTADANSWLRELYSYGFDSAFGESYSSVSTFIPTPRACSCGMEHS
jgi:hypothetical protein